MAATVRVAAGCVLLLTLSRAAEDGLVTRAQKAAWLWAPSDVGSVLDVEHAEHATMVVGREARNRSLVLACYLKNDTARRGALDQVAYFNQNHFVAYAVTSKRHVCEQWEARPPALMVFNPYQALPKSWIKTTEPLANRRVVQSFINSAVEPLVMEFDGSQKQGKKVIKSGVDMLVMLVVGKSQRTGDDAWRRAMDRFSALAHDFVGKAHFFTAAPSNRRVLAYFNISSAGTFPKMATLDMRGGWSRPAKAGVIEMESGEAGLEGMEAHVVKFLGTPDKWKSMMLLGLSAGEAARQGKPLKPTREEPVFE